MSLFSAAAQYRRTQNQYRGQANAPGQRPPYAKERAKGVSYECGMLPIGRNWAQVHVRYYLIAILFLIFDVEIVFIFPWAVTFLKLSAEHGMFVFYEMLVFVGILALGLGYAWRRGVLEWR